MKVFIYDKKESKPYLVLNSVQSVEEKEKTICFTMADETVLEVSKKTYKSQRRTRTEEGGIKMIDENKQEVCDAICKALRTTRSAGEMSGNPLVELRYIPEGNGDYSEVVRPIFADGTGNNGYYDINVGCDSGIAMFIDIVRQFVAKVW